MEMTDEQRYSAVLKELGEVLQDKNTTICCQRWQIDELKAKLEAAEKERDDLCKQYVELNTQLCAAEDEIARLKGGAA